jgi:hypothetical protein
MRQWAVAVGVTAAVLAVLSGVSAVVPDSGRVAALPSDDIETVANTAELTAGKLTGVVIRTATSRQNSSSSNEVQAVCPAGTRVLGGGGKLNGTNGAGPRGGAMLVTSMPHKASVNGPDSWLVMGRERSSGFSGSWSVTATVVCGAQPAGYQIVRRFGDTELDRPSGGGAFTNDAVAPCPSGTKVLGMGAELLFADGRTSIKAILPTAAGTSATAIGVLQAGFSAPLQMQAVAICATAPEGWQVVSSTSATQKKAFITQSASCPAGKRPIGAGVSNRDIFGQVYTEHVNVVSFSTVQKVNVAASYFDPSGSPPTWSIIAFATCVAQ